MACPKRDGDAPETRSPARRKVLQHLRNAALTGAGLALACTGPGSPGGGKGAGPPGGAPPARENDGPPIVCDPLPPPVDCGRAGSPDYLRSVMGQQGRWVKAQEGLAVEVVLTLWARGNPGELAFEEGAQVKGAKLLAHRIEGERYTLTLLPGKGVTQVTADLGLRCEARSERFTVAAEIPARRKEGEGVVVEIVSP